MPCRSLHLSERPFRPLPGGILRKFPRGLGQFPLSFLAKPRWVPRSSGDVRSGHATPLEEPPAAKIKWKGDRPLPKPVAFHASPRSACRSPTAHRRTCDTLRGGEPWLTGSPCRQPLPSSLFRVVCPRHHRNVETQPRRWRREAPTETSAGVPC
jgi:hypothetical protein